METYFYNDVAINKIKDTICEKYPTIRKYYSRDVANVPIVHIFFRDVMQSESYGDIMYDLCNTGLSHMQNTPITPEIVIDETVKYNNFKSTWRRSKYLANCKMIMDTPLYDFIIVKAATKFYGKRMTDYINDATDILSVSVLEKNYDKYNRYPNQVQKDTIISLAKKIIVLQTSITMYYINFFNTFAQNISLSIFARDQYQSFVDNIAQHIIQYYTKYANNVQAENYEIDMLNNDVRNTCNNYLSTKITNIDVDIDSIYDLYGTGISVYGPSANVTNVLLRQNIINLPDFRLFANIRSIIAFKKQVQSNSLRSGRFIYEPSAFYYYIITYLENCIARSKINLEKKIDNFAVDELIIEL